MTDWTTERQAAAQARCDAATKGPWERDAFYVTAEIEGGRPGGEVIIQCHPTTDRRDRERDIANAEFTAHARTDLPDALAELTQAQARIAELEAGRCEHCGATIISDCSTCGAPQCCPQCCRISELEEELEKEKGFKEVQRVNATLGYERAEKQEQRAEQAEAELVKWQRIRTPTHGTCCTCQKCGQYYDDCRCDLDEVADSFAQAEAENTKLREAHRRLKAIIEGGTARGRPLDLVPSKDWLWYMKAQAALRPASAEGGGG